MNPHPSFDTWTTIFLFASIQGIFVSVVLCFVKKENRAANGLLALLIFLFSLTLFEYVMYWTGFMLEFPHTMSMGDSFPFLFGPILYFYFKKVFRHHQFNRVDFLHLVPFLLFILLHLPQYIAPAHVKYLWLTGVKAQPLFSWPFSIGELRKLPWPWIKIIHMYLYTGLIFKQFYSLSKTNREVSTWFNWLNALFMGFILSFTSYFVLVRFDFFNNEWDYMISFSMMFFIYFVAWFGYLQPGIFSGFTLRESIIHPMRYKNTALPDEVKMEILRKVEKVMDENKLYRESDLRLEKLAEAVGTSRHNLSQAINAQTGSGFFDYINSIRIKEAQLLLAEKPKQELNIIEVAYAVGFNNKVSFNSTFKKITGKTPTEFRNSIHLTPNHSPKMERGT